MVISVTEGADKPLKYPHMFAAAGLVVVNKIDLLPYVDFDLEKFGSFVKSINPDGGDFAAVGDDGRWYRGVVRLDRTSGKQPICHNDPLTRHCPGVNPKISAQEVGRRHIRARAAQGPPAPAPESCDACQAKQQSKQKRR